MKKKKILITGSSGFVGKELVNKLIKRKNLVLYLIINKKKLRFRSKNIKYINCSLKNKNILKKKLAPININYVIHCAWVGVDSNNRNSDKQKQNLTIINNIFKAVEKKNLNCFIGIGSQAEYGPKNKVIKEGSKLEPITVYGKTKAIVYKILKKICETKKIRFVWLRIFSGYGPGSTMEWIIPYTIKSLISNKKVIFTSGEQTYNFIFISDIVSAIVKSIFNKDAKGAYNLAYKKSFKIKYVINLIYSYLRVNKNPSFGSIKYRKDQIMRFVPSISKLKKDFNWEPKVGIKEGLKKNIKFLKKINKVN